jgi:hypothetical protein
LTAIPNFSHPEETGLAQYIKKIYDILEREIEQT